jgi:hypothetical protein
LLGHFASKEIRKQKHFCAGHPSCSRQKSEQAKKRKQDEPVHKCGANKKEENKKRDWKRVKGKRSARPKREARVAHHAVTILLA